MLAVATDFGRFGSVAGTITRRTQKNETIIPIQDFIAGPRSCRWTRPHKNSISFLYKGIPDIYKKNFAKSSILFDYSSKLGEAYFWATTCGGTPDPAQKPVKRGEILAQTAFFVEFCTVVGANFPS